MGTSVDHLYRRQSVYWWQRRIPLGLRIEGLYRIARSLRTADPGLARRRACACSAAFDHVIMRVMTLPAPTRADLVRVLDDIFRRILEDGERTRAEREAGPPRPGRLNRRPTPATREWSRRNGTPSPIPPSNGPRNGGTR